MSLSSAKIYPAALRVALAALLLCSVVSSGCASKYGEQKTKVNHYPTCYEPIAELRKSEHTVAKSTAGGAILGGLIGALGGYLATGDAGGAVAGAAVGAVGGGVAGHYAGTQYKNNEDASRLASYSADLDGKIKTSDKATAAAQVARQCYERQFSVAASEYKGGHITKEQFLSRYTEVMSGMEEAAYILGEANKENEQIVTQYQQALNKEADRMGVPKAQVTNKKKRSSQPKMNTDEGKELAKAADKTAAMEVSLNKGKDEEARLRERLDATRKAADDLMS